MGLHNRFALSKFPRREVYLLLKGMLRMCFIFENVTSRYDHQDEALAYEGWSYPGVTVHSMDVDDG